MCLPCQCVGICTSKNIHNSFECGFLVGHSFHYPGLLGVVFGILHGVFFPSPRNLGQLFLSFPAPQSNRSGKGGTGRKPDSNASNSSAGGFSLLRASEATEPIIHLKDDEWQVGL